MDADGCRDETGSGQPDGMRKNALAICTQQRVRCLLHDFGYIFGIMSVMITTSCPARGICMSVLMAA